MVEQLKDKVTLNRVTHSVRATQAVLQYGVGSMVDFPDQTLITTAPEYWSGTIRIYDDRFAKALGVDCFAMPTDISYARFPEWYFCPKCRKFQPIKQWIAEYRKQARIRTIESDAYMLKHMQCPTCHQDLVVARIVTVCQHGHINDFPWIKWVHNRLRNLSVQILYWNLRLGHLARRGWKVWAFPVPAEHRQPLRVLSIMTDLKELIKIRNKRLPLRRKASA